MAKLGTVSLKTTARLQDYLTLVWWKKARSKWLINNLKCVKLEGEESFGIGN